MPLTRTYPSGILANSCTCVICLQAVVLYMRETRVNSKQTKTGMFKDSPGCIPSVKVSQHQNQVTLSRIHMQTFHFRLCCIYSIVDIDVVNIYNLLQYFDYLLMCGV